MRLGTYRSIADLMAEADRLGVAPDTLLPPVTGGSDDDPPEDEPDDEGKFTQAQVNSMVAQHKRDARDATRDKEKAEQALQQLKDKRKDDIAQAEARGRAAALAETGDQGKRISELEGKLTTAERDLSEAQAEVERLTTELEAWENDAVEALPEDLRLLAPDEDEPLRKRKKWLARAQAAVAKRAGAEPDDPAKPPADPTKPEARTRRPAVPPAPKPRGGGPAQNEGVQRELAAMARSGDYRGRIRPPR